MHLKPHFPAFAAIGLAAALLCPVATRADTMEIELFYSSVPGAKIQFDGQSNFTFTPGVSNFQITSGGPGLGLLGEITGSFSIGAVTKVGTVSTAPVSNSGTVVIHDGAQFDLTGTLTWVNITQVGTMGALNTQAGVNLTNLRYGGANSLLLALAASPGTATNALSFQFLPGKSLTALKTTKCSTSFSGSIAATRTVPDGGATAMLLGFALTSTLFLRRRLLT